MDYNINNYSWGVYGVAAKNGDVSVKSNEVGVNIMEVLNKQIKVGYSPQSGSQRIVSINLAMDIILHDVNDGASSNAVVSLHNGDSSSATQIYSQPLTFVSDSENGATFRLTIESLPIWQSGRFVYRFLTLKFSRSNFNGYPDYVIDLDKLPLEDKIQWTLKFTQTKNGGTVKIGLDPYERTIQGMGALDVSIRDGATGTVTNVRGNFASSTLLEATLEGGYTNNSKIHVDGFYTDGQNPTRQAFPAYVVITYVPSDEYNYVNLPTPELFYNAELNQLEWDAISGAEEYEVLRNDVVIATLDADGEVKTS